MPARRGLTGKAVRGQAAGARHCRAGACGLCRCQRPGSPPVPARPKVTSAGMPAVAVTTASSRSTRRPGGEVSAVFFQLGQHAHGERDRGADLLGPALWFLPVPFRDRDQMPAHDGPGPDADRQRFQVPGRLGGQVHQDVAAMSAAARRRAGRGR